MFHPTLPSPRRTALLAAAVIAAAACGRGANQSADRNGADTTSASRTTYGAPVGENKAGNTEGYVAGQQRLDSLQAAGVGTDNALDSAAQRVRTQTSNEPNADTSRLNNRATPGGVSQSGRRP